MSQNRQSASTKALKMYFQSKSRSIAPAVFQHEGGACRAILNISGGACQVTNKSLYSPTHKMLILYNMPVRELHYFIMNFDNFCSFLIAFGIYCLSKLKNNQQY